MLKINQYFGGQVASIAFQGEHYPATVGVMVPGDYEFSTNQLEVMTIISGHLQVKLPNSDTWQRFDAGQQFTVAAGCTFALQVSTDTAYLCSYQ